MPEIVHRSSHSLGLRMICSSDSPLLEASPQSTAVPCLKGPSIRRRSAPRSRQPPRQGRVPHTRQKGRSGHQFIRTSNPHRAASPRAVSSTSQTPASRCAKHQDIPARDGLASNRRSSHDLATGSVPARPIRPSPCPIRHIFAGGSCAAAGSGYYSVLAVCFWTSTTNSRKASEVLLWSDIPC